jgi:hypothetical protein
MTTNLSTERLEELSAGESGFNLRIATYEEAMAMARELLALREVSKQVVMYQFREIGGEGWRECNRRWYEYASLSPEHDTRKLYTVPQPAVVPDGYAMRSGYPIKGEEQKDKDVDHAAVR